MKAFTAAGLVCLAALGCSNGQGSKVPDAAGSGGSGSGGKGGAGSGGSGGNGGTAAGGSGGSGGTAAGGSGGSGGAGGSGSGGAGGAADASVPPPDAASDRVADAATDRSTAPDASLDVARDATTTDATAATYDQLVLSGRPVGYWTMARASTTTEPDLSGNANAGSYRGGAPATATLPNGDTAADFNGSSQYLTIPSRAAYSIPTTGTLTWEAWIRPDVLQFVNDSGGYVDWMGKCADYSPTCEWEARMYSTTNSQNRCNRLSAYVFNPGAGLGSGADWQPTCGLLQAGEWLHVVGEYTTRAQPAACPNPGMYPGSINIWVDGIPWSQSNHNPTGCMGQYNIVPVANNSPVNVGTMAMDAWFAGAIGKLAIYDRLLTQAEITARFQAMTGRAPAGSCGNTCTRTR